MSTRPLKQQCIILLSRVVYVICTYYFARVRSIVMSTSVCLFVPQDISGTIREIFTNFLRMLPMYVARSASGLLTIGRIAYRGGTWEGGDGSGQRGQSVIYDCLVMTVECYTNEWPNA